MKYLFDKTLAHSETINKNNFSLCKNKYSVEEKIPNLQSSIRPLRDDEENLSYDVDSLFTNILIEETINYII